MLRSVCDARQTHLNKVIQWVGRRRTLGFQCYIYMYIPPPPPDTGDHLSNPIKNVGWHAFPGVEVLLVCAKTINQLETTHSRVQHTKPALRCRHLEESEKCFEHIVEVLPAETSHRREMEVVFQRNTQACAIKVQYQPAYYALGIGLCALRLPCKATSNSKLQVSTVAPAASAPSFLIFLHRGGP